eukprot:jgi/Botrbrau1/16779/Bobra.150_2s0014.1
MEFATQLVKVDMSGTSSSDDQSSPRRKLAADAVKGMVIGFKDVTFSVSAGRRKQQKRIKLLDAVSGSFEPGTVSAIMGPTGSGKTTLLDVLAGRKTAGKTEGTIKFSGVVPSKAFYRRYVGYVEQFDTLVGILTVREMLLYTAELKRNLKEPFASKQAAVNHLLEKLSLEDCQNVIVGTPLMVGISGGQAKRTNIAVALITNPRVLFLDEPTSGLDSCTALEVMSMVRDLAYTGITVVASVHSPTPACFCLFDRLLLLVRGRVAYLGKPGEEAVMYFEETAPEKLKLVLPELTVSQPEWLSGLLTSADKSSRGTVLADRYTNSDLYKKNMEDCSKAVAEDQPLDASVAAMRNLNATSETVTPWWWALWILIKYRLLKEYKNPEFLGPRIGEKIIFNFIIMTLYWGIGKNMLVTNIGNISAGLAMWCTLPAFAAVSYIPGIKLEYNLFVRERNDGLYRVITYLLFKIATEMIITFLASLVFSCAVFFPLKLRGLWVYFWLNYLATLTTGILMAYFFAAISPTLDIANVGLQTYAVTLLFFSGFLIRYDDMPKYWRWYSYLNFLSYSWSGLIINQFHGVGGRISNMAYIDLFGARKQGGPDKWVHLAIVWGFSLFFFVGAWAGLAYCRHVRR